MPSREGGMKKIAGFTGQIADSEEKKKKSQFSITIVPTGNHIT